VTLACNFCGEAVCPEGSNEDLIWKRLCMHIWLEHPECITKEGKIVHMWIEGGPEVAFRREE